MANADRVVVDGVNYIVGNVASVNGQTGDVVLNASDVGAVQSVNGQTGDVVLSASDVGAVQSVNGQTGDVVLSASDVGAVQSVNGKTGAVILSPADIGAKATQTAKSSPSTSGTGVEFIDTISQDAQGVITATKKTVRTATTSQAGLMSATDKTKLDTVSDEVDAALYNFATTYDLLSWPVSAGKLVLRNSYLYMAKQDIPTQEAWTSSHWRAIDVNDIKVLLDADIADTHALALAAYPAMSAHGDDVTIADTVAIPLRGLTIYGKSVQSSTPAPDAPVDIATVGGDGTLAISLTDGNDTGTYNLPTSNGLPGIKDASGNYTDASSQQWLCDTIDKATGKYTLRVGVFTLDGSYTPTSIETVGSYTRFWYQVSATSMTPSTGTLCSHLPYDPSGYSQARAGFGIDASYPRNIWAKLPTSLVGSTAASIKAWMQSNPMTLVAALAAPVTTDLTAEQTSALASMTAFDGSTRVYTSGAVSPDLDVSAAVTVEAYVDYRLSSIS